MEEICATRKHRKNVEVPSTALGEEVVSNVCSLQSFGVETPSILMKPLIPKS
jgi:hypothetical protein